MANTARSNVVGVFENREQAQCAVEGLKRLGLSEEQIGYAMRGEEGSTVAGASEVKGAGKGAAGGAVTGGLLGALLGAAAALLIPGIGPVVAGGVLASALGGAAIGAAAGGILGALVGLGVPEEEARYYDQEFQAGRILVTAKADGRYNEAYQVLRGCGAYDVNTRGTASQTTRTERAGAEATRAKGGETVRLREEQLRAEKQPVQTGEVGIRKEVVSEQKTIDVPVTREEVVIERRPVNELARGEIREGEEIHVPVTEEQVRVEKQPVVREEINVRKEAVQDTQRVSEEVRREEARIERKGDVNVRGEDVER